MKPYPSYKDSGVEWIGEIPSHWDRLNLKYLLSQKVTDGPHETPLFTDNGIPFLSVDGIQDGELIFEGCRHISFEDHQKFRKKCNIKKDDILMGKAASIGKIARVKVDFEFSVWSPLALLKPNKIKSDSNFFEYALKSAETQYQIEILCTSNTQKNISMDDIPRIILMLPPKSEQEAIANYLVYKMQKIEELIKKTQKKIELLKEQRISLINHCVTKGLNPNVKMKDSGVEWIGEIPRSWTLSKLKYDTIIPVRYGLNISSDRYTEKGVRFIRITDLNDWGILNHNNGKYLIESDVDKEFLLSKYDLLLCRSGHTVGKSYLHLEDGKYTSGGYLVRFNFGNYYPSKFIFYITKTGFYWYWIRLNTIISTIENVNGEKYSNMEYPRPPLPEQQQIVEYLDEQTQKIDTTIEKETKRIELLKEYRQALISEVVTGKIDVRDEVIV